MSKGPQHCMLPEIFKPIKHHCCVETLLNYQHNDEAREKLIS